MSTVANYALSFRAAAVSRTANVIVLGAGSVGRALVSQVIRKIFVFAALGIICHDIIVCVAAFGAR